MRQLELRTEKMLAHVEDGVGWITFNQPEKRNAVSLAMWEAVPDIIDDFVSNDVRVVVLKGAGDKAFVSGADISEFEEVRSTPDTPYLWGLGYSKLSGTMTNCRFPSGGSTISSRSAASPVGSTSGT